MVLLDVLRRNLAQHEPLEVEGESVKRRAAVAAILREGGARGPEALLIKRVDREGDPWSGQMAFPGGRHEPDDVDLLATAIRESREEVGLHLPDHAELIGRLDDLRTHTGDMLVRPYVFLLHGPVVLSPNVEVAEIHWGELGPMLRGERDTHFEWQGGPTKLRFPGYDVSGRVVWGLTHRMLDLLLRMSREAP